MNIKIFHLFPFLKIQAIKLVGKDKIFKCPNETLVIKFGIQSTQPPYHNQFTYQSKNIDMYIWSYVNIY